MKSTSLVLWFLLLLAATATVKAQFAYTTNNGIITLSAYTGPGGAVVISNFVTSIGQSAFFEKSVTSVTIPNSVTSIGQWAFEECSLLTNVIIGNSVGTIGPLAFSGTSLATVAIPASVTNLGPVPFVFSPLTAINVSSNNPAYSSVDGVLFDKGQTTLVEYPDGTTGTYTIPSSVTNVGGQAFSDTHLTGITVPSTVTTIGGYAFSDTALAALYFLGNAPAIDASAFESASPSIYYLPGATGWGFFSAATGLPAQVEFDYSINSGNPGTITITHAYAGGVLVIPASINGLAVTCVGDGADSVIAKPGVTSVSIPGSVTTIAAAAFEDSPSLTSVTIPAGVLTIGSNAFSDTSLATVSIPASVTNIGTEAFVPSISPNIPIPSLAAINVDADSLAYGSMAGVLFDKNQTVLLQYPPAKIGTAYVIPSTVTNIGIDAFFDSSLTNITIPNLLTIIGSGAFEGCTGLASMTIPAGVTNIGASPFGGCYSLVSLTVEAGNPAYASIGEVLFNKNQTTLIQYPSGLGGSYTIPGTVTTIGAGAFDGCFSLTGITIPASVTSIGDEAFLASSLATVTIPGSVTNLGQLEFFDCTSLATVIIADGVTSIGVGMFDYCPGLSSLTIPNSVTNIGSNAFVGCASLASVSIPSGVISIGSYAFNGCTGLVSVTIPDNLASIGDYAFQECTELASVSIPSTVTNIGNLAFYECSSLASIAVSTNNPAYASADGVLFNKSQTTLIQYPLGSLQTVYTIPNGVTTIGAHAFDDSLYYVDGDFSLTNIIIPGSVTTIGDYAFFDCYSLTGLYFLGNAPATGFSVTSDYENATVYYLPVTVGWGSTFCGLPTAVWIQFAYTVQNGAVTITGYAGPGGAVAIPDTINGLPVTGIGAGAFASDSLTSVMIPNSVTSIGDNAFQNCSALHAIYFQGNAPTADSTVFSGDSNVSLYYLAGSTGWGSTFSGLPTAIWIQFACTVENGAVTITGYTGPSGAVAIPATITGLPVTSIGNDAFAGYHSLASITIPNGVTSIGTNAFAGCPYLASVAIPGSVTNIGAGAFSSCASLAGITIPDSVASIGDYAFESCLSLTNASLADGVTSIGIEAFDGCTNLGNVVIPPSVASLGDDAFQDCWALTGVYFQGNAPTADSTLFSGDNNATLYYEPWTTGWGQSFGGLATAVWIQVAYTTQNGMITITGYNGPGNDVIIPAAIYGAPVTSIALGAFAYETAMTGITIPGSVTSIGGYAFQNCASLSSVDMGNGVTNIGQLAFYECASLASVTLPNSVTSIGGGAFDDCSGLTNITLGNSVTSIGEEAFYGSGITGITIPNSMTSIGEETFWECPRLASITIPASVTNIGINAFEGCTSLSNVTILGSVTSIGGGAFVSCTSLSSINIPSSVTSIGDYAFQGCYSLAGVYFQGNAPTADSTVFVGIFANTFDPATIYYLPGAAGWISTFAGLPTSELAGINATASPTNGRVPLTVSFSSPGVDSAGKVVNNWNWNFGDGSTSAVQNLSHTYTSVGVFYAVVIESNSTGGVTAGSRGLSIIVSPPAVAFTANPTNGMVPLPVSFTSAGIDSAGNPISHWNWNFGDGSTSTVQNPSHTYAVPGAFSPLLIATNSIGGMVAGSGPPAIVVTPGTNCFGPPSGLISWWTGQSNALDIAGGNNGTLEGEVTFTNGEVGQAFNFDGATGFVSTSLLVTNPQSFSLSLWFKTATTRGGVLLGFGQSKSNTTADFDRNLYLDNSGAIHFGVFESTEEVVSSASGYNDNQWHHVVASLSSSTGISLYVDGVLAGNNPAADSAASYNGYWIIGENNLGSWPFQPSSYYFNGEIDEISIFNRALSASEVQSIYDAASAGMCEPEPVISGISATSGAVGSAITIQGTNLAVVAAVMFDGTPAQFILQSSGELIVSVPTNATTGPITLETLNGWTVTASSNFTVTVPECTPPPSGLISWWPGQSNALDIAGGNNGTLMGGVTFTTGEVGQAFNLDGTTGFISTSLLVTNPQSFSLSLWFKTATARGGVLLGFGQSKSNTTANYDRNLYLDNTGTIHFGVFESTEEVVNSPPSYNDGLWHQVVASLSASTGISLYVDGVLEGTNLTATSAANYNGYWIMGENNLGGWPFQPSSYYFNGEIDEISIFNRALSASEVQSIYNAASAGMCNGLIFNTSPTGLQLTKSGLELQLDGLTELGPVVIYASSNLVFWTPIYTNPPVASPIQFLDPTATNLPFRFYRAAQQ